MIGLQIDNIESFNKEYDRTRKLLDTLFVEMDNSFLLRPNTPLTLFLQTLMNYAVQKKITEIKKIPISAANLARRKQGGQVPVTKTGEERSILSESTETGMRTGWLFGSMKHLDPFGTESRFGYRTMNMRLGGGAAYSEFMVLLDANEFYQNYPVDFSQWLMSKTGLGLLDLDDETNFYVLDRACGFIVKRIETKLRKLVAGA